MDNQTLIMPIVDARVRMFTVQFTTSLKTYTYKCSDLSVKEGSLVVVQVNEHYSIARVLEQVTIPMSETDIKYKWIVCSIDEDGFKDLLATEQNVIDKVNNIKMDSMRAKMLEALGIDADTASMISGNPVDAEVVDEKASK